MVQLYRLPLRHDPRSARLRPAIFFNRLELNQLLSLYSRQVARGEWRDYAIDQRGSRAVFSVFRHSQAAPLFRISKRSDGCDRSRRFEVTSGREVLRAGATLSDALEVFRRRPQSFRNS
jgi:hypothetical protein